ncbi:hypothetical protein QE152_g7129 [Popillia japonica]|uniref:Uncharacterized protein n=1 Tax=Popillia japonica TaxID=7064 RepID=A0AAW1MCI5_POPJA
MNKLASHGGIYCLGQLREFRVKGDSPGLGLEKKVTISYEQALELRGIHQGIRRVTPDKPKIKINSLGTLHI